MPRGTYFPRGGPVPSVERNGQQLAREQATPNLLCHCLHLSPRQVPGYPQRNSKVGNQSRIMPRGIPKAKQDESAMRFTSFHVPLPSVPCSRSLPVHPLIIKFRSNPKHVGSTYLKSEVQTLGFRNTAKANAAGKLRAAPDDVGTSTPTEVCQTTLSSNVRIGYVSCKPSQRNLEQGDSKRSL